MYSYEQKVQHIGQMLTIQVLHSGNQVDGCLHNSFSVSHHFVLMLEYFPADAGKKEHALYNSVVHQRKHIIQ